MSIQRPLTFVLILSISLTSLTACESLPGNKKEQGAVIGGVGGAVAGAAIGGNNRLIGALIGGALGAGGGYLIGAQMDKTDPKNHDQAVQAAQQAEKNPAQPADVKNSTTADLNHDGYVTLDEVVAMKRAGLTDDQMIQRIRATHQVFELTSQQQQYLRDHGVDDTVINAMLSMTPSTTQPASSQQLNMGSERISQ